MGIAGATIKPLVSLGRCTDDCWQWLGPILPGGYGKKQFHGRTYLAHRWLWMQLFGPIPDGLVIDHVCQNRSCVNPHHLRAVTQAENCRSGETTKLTPGDLVEIKAIPAKDRWRHQERLQLKFGISRQLLCDIWAGRAWSKAKQFHGPTGKTLPHIDDSQNEAA